MLKNCAKVCINQRSDTIKNEKKLYCDHDTFVAQKHQKTNFAMTQFYNFKGQIFCNAIYIVDIFGDFRFIECAKEVGQRLYRVCVAKQEIKISKKADIAIMQLFLRKKVNKSTLRSRIFIISKGK